jgi:NADPH-dependent F420 reductase
MATDRGTLIRIAVLGGTGKEGSGLAMRWAHSGYHVIIGSRDAERAAQRAAEMNQELGGDYLMGTENSVAARDADLVVLSVPYGAHEATLKGLRDQLQGKILIDLTVALKPPQVRQVNLPPGQSSALEAQAILGGGVQVIAAFQNVSSDELNDLEHKVACDVLVCGDDPKARETVIQLAEAAGMRGIHAGTLENSIAVEAMTPVLLFINKRYGIRGSGIRITGVD